jgi:hypothetical protein
MELLHVDICRKIVNFFDHNDYLRVCSINHFWSDIVFSEKFWKEIYPPFSKNIYWDGPPIPNSKNSILIQKMPILSNDEDNVSLFCRRSIRDLTATESVWHPGLTKHKYANNIFSGHKGPPGIKLGEIKKVQSICPLF